MCIGQTDGGNLSEVPSSQVTLGFVQLTVQGNYDKHTLYKHMKPQRMKHYF